MALSENWYSDYNVICPKVNTKNLVLSFSQIGEGTFQLSISDSKGNIASLLPDRSVTYTVNGKTYTTTLVNGVAVFEADAADGDSIKATVDNSDRKTNYDSNTPEKSPQYPESTSTPDYPDIQYPGDGGDGQGDSGSGSGSGNAGDNTLGNKDQQNQNSERNENSSAYHNQNPGKGNSQVDDVSQSDNLNSASSESASQSGSAAGSQSQSVVKQIVIEDDDIFRVTGISLIVILIILTIGLYYRDDIKEMNSKR